MYRMSCVMFNVSYITCHMKHVTWHVSNVIWYHYSLTVRARDLKFWQNAHHPLFVTCHRSLIMCHCHIAHVCVMCHLSQVPFICHKFAEKYFMFFVVCAYNGQVLSISTVLKLCHTNKFYLLFFSGKQLPIIHGFLMKAMPHHDVNKFLLPLPWPTPNLDQTVKQKIGDQNSLL